uniref:Uncharacterized protein n=1 Tax=Fagus sylvatica TaxID=28930 RepID=A0A2N9ENJ1_FAGSY
MEDFGSFKRLKEEVTGDGNKTRQQVEDLLTERVMINLLNFLARKNQRKASASAFNSGRGMQRLRIGFQRHQTTPRNRNAENEEDWVPEKPNPPKKRPPDPHPKPNLKPNAPTPPNPPSKPTTRLASAFQESHQRNEWNPIEDEIKGFDKHDKVMEEVPFIDPSGEVNTMTLTQWDMRKPSGTKSSSYILRTNWNKVLKANLKTTSELKAKRVIQIWSFRRQVGDEQQLGLALVVLKH